MGLQCFARASRNCERPRFILRSKFAYKAVSVGSDVQMATVRDHGLSLASGCKFTRPTCNRSPARARDREGVAILPHPTPHPLLCMHKVAVENESRVARIPTCNVPRFETQKLAIACQHAADSANHRDAAKLNYAASTMRLPNGRTRRCLSRAERAVASSEQKLFAKNVPVRVVPA